MRHMPGLRVVAGVLLLCQLLGAQTVGGIRRKNTLDVHVGPNAHDFVQPARTSFPHLTYQGGATVANASFWTVYWGPYWTTGIGLLQRKHFNSFVQTVAPSAGFAGQFAEYQKPGNPVLAGGFGGEVSIANGPGASIDDSAIQSQISSWILAGALAVPDANTVYVILPPAGTDVTIHNGSGMLSACSDFFGYHSSGISPSGTFGFFRYIVLPYQACGADIAADGPVTVDGMTDTLGHEMAETETDPDHNSRPAAWFDSVLGDEIADICADTSATVGYLGFWLQKIWSNAAATCIAPVSGSAAIHLTISTAKPSGVANVLAGFPATFTVSTDSAAPVSLSVTGLPPGVTYTLNPPTVTATTSATLEVSAGASPGSLGTSLVTASANGQQAQFQFLVAPWRQVSTVNVSNSGFTYNSSLQMYSGSITVQNTGAESIGPTILLGHHGLDTRIIPSIVGVDNVTSKDALGPNGDFVVPFPDGMLSPNQSVSVNVAFSNPSNLTIAFTPQIFEVQTANRCDASQDQVLSVADVQLLINEALGTDLAADDLNGDGAVDIVDVEIDMNAALGLGCTSVG